jgi:hypothetical protein
MLVRRLSAGALGFIAVLTLVCGRVSSDTGDKQLARVKGVVGYQASATSEFKPIFGRLDLPDDAYAVTKPNATAVLRLKDSSEIDIGENTKVQVGAFNPAASGQTNTIVLDGGALHFNIRHPQGGQSNYRFVTATSQIAVRGTEGFLVAGVNGTQVVCVSCAAGDVSVQVGSQSVSLLSNQTLTVLGNSPLSATTSITTNPSVNNPAVNQFNSNQNPFSPTTTTTSVDPTGSLSGTGGAGSVVSNVGTGTTTAAAGAAAGTAAVVATSAKSAPSPTPGPGTLVLHLSFPGAIATFPYAFSWPFSQLNATGNATFSCTPLAVITCTANQNLGSNTDVAVTGATNTLNGVLTGTLNGPGTFTIAGSASGYTLPAQPFNVYSAVTLVTPSSGPIAFTQVPSSQNITVTQLPAGSGLTAAVTCAGGASAANVTLTGASGPSPLTFAMTAHSASTGQTPTGCTLTVTGQGDGQYASLTVPVNVTGSNIGISSNRRKPL